jgi:hypothetical protein
MGTKTIRTFTEKVPLQLTRPDEAVKVGVTMKDGFANIEGDVIGLITSSGLARRRSRTTATGTGFSTGSNTGQVTDAGVFAAGDVLKNEGAETIGTVQSIDRSTTPDTVVLTGNAAVVVASGEAVLASDGSQVAKGIADDASDADGDTPIGVFVTGILDAAKLRGLDDSAKLEMAGASMAGGAFKF